MALEEIFDQACDNQEIPGAVLVANGPGVLFLLLTDRKLIL